MAAVTFFYYNNLDYINGKFVIQTLVALILSECDVPGVGGLNFSAGGVIDSCALEAIASRCFVTTLATHSFCGL